LETVVEIQWVSNMKIAELAIILDRIRQLYLSGGAKGSAKDIKALSDVLGSHADKSVEVFVSMIESRLGQPSNKPNRRKGASAPSKPLNEDSIRYHITQLGRAGTDRTEFDRALEGLKADKALRLADFAEIARQYSDSVTKYKSIDSTLQDISKAFVRQGRFENKLR
jgi:hypothetical protein